MAGYDQSMVIESKDLFRIAFQIVKTGVIEYGNEQLHVKRSNMFTAAIEYKNAMVNGGWAHFS